MKQRARICIIVPAYEEATVISDVIHSLKTRLKTEKITADIVVVDDGSGDDTGNNARQAGAFVIGHILNSGTGSATATGLSYADQENYDLAVTMDGDGQHTPEDVVKGIRLGLESSTDLLIGSRLIDATGMALVKRIGNWGLTIVTFLLFGVRTTDSQSGLRVFSKNALQRLRWKTAGYEFCSEMIWRARRAKLTISEFPIRAVYTDYSKSKGQNNWNGVNILKSLVRQRVVELFE